MNQKNNKDLTLNCSSANCFVAGTLIHALDKQGKAVLIPIEELKVGDLVLSRDEHNPHAPVGYKPILKTYKSEKRRPISMFMLNKYHNGQPFDIENGIEETPEEHYKRIIKYPVFCTREHPFFDVKQQKWVAYNDINFSDYTYLATTDKTVLRVGKTNTNEGDHWGEEVLQETSYPNLTMQQYIGELKWRRKERAANVFYFKEGRPVLVEEGRYTPGAI